MYHRFSATPGKARSQSKVSASDRTGNNSQKNVDAVSESKFISTTLPPAKRQKIARACDRCRVHRIKCDAKKPCGQCINVKAECIMTSSAPSRPSQTTNSDTNDSSHERSSAPTSTTTLPSSAQVNGSLDSTQPLPSQNSGSTGSLFLQFPHAALPSGERSLVSNELLKNQRSFYLRLYWDVCHPFLPILTETELAELDNLPIQTTFDKYSSKYALIDSIIALSIQYSHVTALTGRVLGLQQLLFPQHSQNIGWPGFEYYERCRERMRTYKEVTLEALRCHVLMAQYLMNGNAFHDAYNLLGITVRKAYVVKLHRLPPSQMPEAEKTAHMQLWWMLFSLDIQCSLQLNMPPASQKCLVKCSIPAEDALARYISAVHRPEDVNVYKYSTRLVDFAVTVADIGQFISTVDLTDDDELSPAALENHASQLFSALQTLESWHDQLPPELLLNRRGHVSSVSETLDLHHDLSLPIWSQRQKAILELQYHNVFALIQRPFIRIHYVKSNVFMDTMSTHEAQYPQVERHITSALHHAVMVIDIAFTICSMSDVLYGWPQVIQPLWNATLTILAYVSTSAMSVEVPRALDALTRAQAIFECFSTTCATTLSAKNIVVSLISSLQNFMTQNSTSVTNSEAMSSGLFASLLEEQQTTPYVLDNSPSFNDLYGNGLFSPLMPSTMSPSTTDFNSTAMQFGNP